MPERGTHKGPGPPGVAADYEPDRLPVGVQVDAPVGGDGVDQEEPDTDGLVETRARSFDDGIDLLSSALAALPAQQTPAQICDALVDAMVGDDPEDDVALLASASVR